MGLTLVQKQSLQLKLAPAMYQSVKLLQYNHQELAGFIREKALENPLLRVKEPSYTANYAYKERDSVKSTTDVIEETLAQTDDFRERLHRELHYQFLDESCMRAADWLIDSLNDDGYLDGDLEDLLYGFNLDEAGMNEALAAVQSLDPAGVGARSLAECLLLQLKRQEKRSLLAETIISEYSEYFLTKDWAGLSGRLGKGRQEVAEAVKRIRALHPAPVRTIQEETVPYVLPDVTIVKNGGSLALELEDRYLPKVTVNEEDYRMYLQSADDETRRYLREKIDEAGWLVMSLSKRSQTLVALTEMVIEKQKDYFMTGKKERLRPFTMKEAAEKLSLSESTISRAASNKYVRSPYGLSPLKKFFMRGIKSQNGGTSVYRIQSIIRDLISKEDKRKPFSDNHLAGLLREKGLHCSRRAVTKYRQACGIGSTLQRKQVR
ncbi:RNA polymerase sigma-54 factor [Sporolactobacillus sp. THM7-7]|nr:RNA polymerase sigma-54 factor [Sporolactobacillus sp. THM7-7]